MITAAGMSDEDDSDEGFSFGSSLSKQISNFQPPLDARTLIQSELFAAVKQGDLCAIQKALNNNEGVTLETPLQGNWTALMHTCSDVNIPVLRFLINEGCSVNDHVALFTPLMAVCSTSHNSEENILTMVKILLENGANVNFTDAHGTTALMLACQVGHVSVVSELLANRAKVNLADNQGHTALFWAVNENHYKICSLLIEKNCDINIQDARGTSCYQLASSKGYTEIVELLDSCAGGRKPNPYWSEARSIIENTDWRNIIPGNRWCGLEEPPYYADVDAILNGMELEHHVPDIIHKKISLTEFLLFDEQQLQSLSFLLPYERRIILQHLKLFHVKCWSKHSISRPQEGEDFNIFNLLMQISAHYKHILTIYTTIKALNKLSVFETGMRENNKLEIKQAFHTLSSSLADLKKQLKIVQNILIKVTKATEEPVDFINCNMKIRSRRNWFKYTIFTFVPLAAVYSIKKVVHF